MKLIYKGWVITTSTKLVNPPLIGDEVIIASIIFKVVKIEGADVHVVMK